MKIKKHIESARKFIDRFDPITSKCLHDNIFAIAGQSAFFLILSAILQILPFIGWSSQFI